MTKEQYLKNLEVPQGKVDVVLDTDTYNEVDDQFAVAYLLANRDKLNIKAFYAAPFYNENSSSPADGMEKSFRELCTLLDLAGFADFKHVTFRGAVQYLADEKTPVHSEAAEHLVNLARTYSPQNPLYVVAIGAITNIASALLLCPQIAENIVVVWLGGHTHTNANTREFNMRQDIAAARVVMGSGAPFVQLPCVGCVSAFTISYIEMDALLRGKNKLCDYLTDTVGKAIGLPLAQNAPYARVIWDVTAVAWLLNDGGRFMDSDVRALRLPTYENVYGAEEDRPMRYVHRIDRNALAIDLFEKLGGLR